MRAIMKLAVLTVAVLAAKRTYSAVSRARAGASNKNSDPSGAYPSDMSPASANTFARSDAV